MGKVRGRRALYIIRCCASSQT